MALNSKQLLAIPLMVSGKKLADVAKKLEVTPQTISEWNKSPEFLAYLNRRKMECLDVSLDILRSRVSDLVEELIRLALNAENEEVRRKAIMDVLEVQGIKNPQSGVYGWGVGPTNIKLVEKDLKKDANLHLFTLG